MRLPRIFPQHRFRAAFGIAGGLGLFYLIVNALVLGGDRFVFRLNSIIVSPLAIITSVMAALLWQKMKNGMQNRILWGGVLFGWIFWAVAESLWAIYSIQGQDPYPSWADFFFLIGYIPLSIGFLSRFARLPKRPGRIQRAISGIISLVVVFATTVFIFIPIIQNYDPQRLLESLLSLFYPLADLFILLLVLNLLFTYGPGDYGLGWKVILIGFITVTISDLVFSFANWNGLYYPDSRATFISTIGVDWLYSISYMLWAIGIYFLLVLLGKHEILKINFQPTLVPNTHILLFTNKDERLIDVSQNYYRLFPVQNVKQKHLAEVLGISSQKESLIHQKLMVNHKFSEEMILVTDIRGVPQNAWLSGLAFITPPNEYSGAVLLLRMFARDDEIKDGLSEYQKSLVLNVLNKSDSQESNEVKRFFWDYYLAFIKSIFNLTLREGGVTMSQTLLDELQTVSNRNSWGLDFNPQTILDSNSPAYFDIPADALPVLLETAKLFASQLTDPFTVETQMKEVHSQFGEAVQNTAARYGGSIRNISS